MLSRTQNDGKLCKYQQYFYLGCKYRTNLMGCSVFFHNLDFLFAILVFCMLNELPVPGYNLWFFQTIKNKIASENGGGGNDF